MDDKLIWELNAVKANITAMNSEVKKLEATRDDLSEQILEEMAAANSSLFRTAGADEQGKRITVSVNPEDVANVEDWAEFEEYIYDNRALYLLQRRPSNPSYRDEVAIKGTIPGVETFTKQKLSLKHV
jgi:hypothetical protein